MSTQNYANHTYQPVLSSVAAAFWAMAVIGFAAAWRGRPWGVGLGIAGVMLAMLCLISISRGYTTRLQDRIILLEEQVRAQRLLGASQLARWQTLGIRQVAALRFASDAEFASLLEQTIAEGLKPDAIKRAVKDWREDRYRT